MRLMQERYAALRNDGEGTIDPEVPHWTVATWSKIYHSLLRAVCLEQQPPSPAELQDRQRRELALRDRYWKMLEPAAACLQRLCELTREARKKTPSIADVLATLHPKNAAFRKAALEVWGSDAPLQDLARALKDILQRAPGERMNRIAEEAAAMVRWIVNLRSQMHTPVTVADTLLLSRATNETLEAAYRPLEAKRRQSDDEECNGK